MCIPLYMRGISFKKFSKMNKNKLAYSFKYMPRSSRMYFFWQAWSLGVLSFNNKKVWWLCLMHPSQMNRSRHAPAINYTTGKWLYLFFSFKDQIVKDDVTSSQYYYFGRQTAKIIDHVNAMTNEIRYNISEFWHQN